MTVTIDEAAQIAGVTTATLRQWVMRGYLEPVRRGAKPLRFHYKDVARAQRDRRSGDWEARHAGLREQWLAGVDGCDLSR